MKGQEQKLSKKDIENLDFEISFYEGLIQKNPNFVDALIPLGDAYTKRGLYKKGLEVDLKLVDLESLDPIVHYNLACSYSLLENQELALKSLEKSLRLGYRDIRFIREDPDLENLRRDDRFSELIKKYIKKG